MKIAVSGANGHIGSNLCRRLIEQGHQVRALVHKNNQGIKGLPMDIVQGDLMDPRSLSDLVQGIEIVFHLAAIISIKAKIKDDIFEKNVGGTENIINASLRARVRKFIHFSSVHALVHEPFDQTMDENRPLANEDRIRYSRSKALAEEVVLKAVKDGLDAVTLNPSAVIGPLDFGPSLLGRALILMYLGKLPALVSGGYDWVDVRDVVESAVAAIEKGRNGERYILSGHWKSIQDLSELISELSNKRSPSLFLPVAIARIGLPFLKLYSLLKGTELLYTKDSLKILQTGHKHMSCEKARRELGFNPRPIEQSLRDTLDWFKENGFINQ